MKRMSPFEIYVRWGLIVDEPVDIETKFNGWHDPNDGRFTFAGQGRYFAGGVSANAGRTSSPPPARSPTTRAPAPARAPQPKAGGTTDRSPARQAARSPSASPMRQLAQFVKPRSPEPYQNAGTPLSNLGAVADRMRREVPANPRTSSPRPAVDKNGNVIAPYAADNLNLGANEKCRSLILKASARFGIEPHAIAAIIDAEAAKKANGEWNPASVNPQRATGLNQVVPSTWLGLAKDPSTLLGMYAKTNGYYDQSGKFDLKRSSEFLQLRLNPLLNTMASMDLNKTILRKLQASGLIADQLDPAAKAKLLYLVHHEGEPNARRFLRGDMGYVDRELLKAQVISEAAVQKWIKIGGGTVGGGYRAWLLNYIDERIDITRFMIIDKGVVVPSARSVYPKKS